MWLLAAGKSQNREKERKPQVRRSVKMCDAFINTDEARGSRIRRSQRSAAAPLHLQFHRAVLTLPKQELIQFAHKAVK